MNGFDAPLPCDPPDRLWARFGWRLLRGFFVVSGALMGIGVFLVCAAVIDKHLIRALLTGGEWEPDPLMPTFRSWIWGWRCMLAALLLLPSTFVGTVGLWWLDRAGGPYHLRLKRRARAELHTDTPFEVLARMLEIEHAGDGRRPEHVLQYALSLPHHGFDRVLLEELKDEMLVVVATAIDSLRRYDGQSIPQLDYAGRSYDPGELRSLAERANDAIWNRLMPRQGRDADLATREGGAWAALRKADRILVTGNAGSGRSTVAAFLANELDLPHHGLDSIVWKPRWVPTPKQERLAAEGALATQERWVIDGVSTAVLPRAQIVIFLDVPVSVALWRVLVRAAPYLFRSRPGLPENCPEIRILPHLIRLVVQFPKRTRLGLLEAIDAQNGTELVWLSTDALGVLQRMAAPASTPSS